MWNCFWQEIFEFLKLFRFLVSHWIIVNNLKDCKETGEKRELKENWESKKRAKKHSKRFYFRENWLNTIKHHANTFQSYMAQKKYRIKKSKTKRKKKIFSLQTLICQFLISPGCHPRRKFHFTDLNSKKDIAILIFSNFSWPPGNSPSNFYCLNRS